MKPQPVVLIGPPASGKTSVGNVLEERSGGAGADLDTLIEKRTGKAIAEIIRVEGEERFRELESEALREALDGRYAVLSVGGGAVLRPENRALMLERARVVALTASDEELARRVVADEERSLALGGGPVRPLLAADDAGGGCDRLRVEQRLAELLEQRRGAYSFAPLTVWTDVVSAPEAADAASKVLEALGDEAAQVSLFPSVLAGRSAEAGEAVVLAPGTCAVCGHWARVYFPHAEKVALVTDDTVAKCWGRLVRESLEAEGFRVEVLKIRPGERSKVFGTIQLFAEQLAARRFSRSDIVVGLGGGVVGDLAGLLASLYMRGVGLMHLPGTVVAQVDSAIGGKTGVNLESGKNLLGTFYPARIVLADPELLSTLPEREYRAGLAEVVKYGVIGSQRLFQRLENTADQVAAREKEVVREVIGQCIAEKLRFAAGDLRDTRGRRVMLNFGHTAGHAVEVLTGYQRFLHGEAVAIGMVAAVQVGETLGLTPPEVRERLVNLLTRFGLPTEIPADLRAGSAVGARGARERWKEALSADKKRGASEIDFVVARAIGRAEARQVDIETLIRGLVPDRTP